ncbi:hypothetical protein AC1031_013982 [Aphanomyces cochlioides]|nr:hypothetical protein AC1031_013982 [Aphanomyces cochlioides]
MSVALHEDESCTWRTIKATSSRDMAKRRWFMDIFQTSRCMTQKNGMFNVLTVDNVDSFNKMRSFDPPTQSPHAKATVLFHHRWRQHDMNEYAMYFQRSAS